MARAFVSAPEKVMNMIAVAGSDQVTLKVRVVEVQRNAIKQLGFDTQAVLGRVGDTQWLLGNNATWGAVGHWGAPDMPWYAAGGSPTLRPPTA